MEQKMEAILIDPHTETVSVVDFNGDFREISRIIGDGCRTFTVVNIGYSSDEIFYSNDGIFVDDEGLLREQATPFFKFRGYPQPLAGRGLILGADEMGESISPRVTLQQVKDSVEFLGYGMMV